MTPLVMGGLFGWLHTPVAAGRRNTAVLICPGLNYDALDSYQSLRVLADQLAEAGYPAMRFDYQGTGDSVDLPELSGGKPTSPLPVWQKNINQAADQLRDLTGAERIVLCGIRMGAALAAAAAVSKPDVAGLILLAPVIRGRSYLRQMQVEAALQYKESATNLQGLNFHELSLDADALTDLSALDLRGLIFGVIPRIALFVQEPSSVILQAAAAWEAHGTPVQIHGFDGLAPMLCHDTQGDKLPPDPAQIIGWLLQEFPQATAAVAERAPGAPVLRLPDCAERPLRFGPDERLFGIFCRPKRAGQDLAVVIVNTGRHPRHGVGRFGVEFARKLAEQGIASLRIDFAGLGDSKAAGGDADLRSDVFEDARSADISAAVDALERLGFGRFAVQGLCSGAYHAFHGGLADARIGNILLVNLPIFVWQPGDTIAAAKQRTYTLSHYGARLADKSMWIKLLQGRSDVAGIVAGQVKRTYQRAKQIFRPGPEPEGYAGSGKLARRGLRTLAERGARTLFLFDPDNVGVYEMELHFGKAGAGLRSFAGTSVQIVPGLDTILTRRETRAIAASRMIDFLASDQVDTRVAVATASSIAA